MCGLVMERRQSLVDHHDLANDCRCLNKVLCTHHGSVTAALDTFWTQPGKTTRVLSIARQVVTQRGPNAKVLPIPAQKTEALHCIALQMAICACAHQRLAKHAASSAQPKWPATAWRSLWAVPPRASRWWGFLKPGLELRAVFGTRAKHSLISNKCNKHKNYGVFL